MDAAFEGAGLSSGFFIEEYGFGAQLFAATGFGLVSAGVASAFGEPAAVCAENGLRNMLFPFLGTGELVPELGGVVVCPADRKGIGLAFRDVGHES